MKNLYEQLKKTPVQILALDKRKDSWEELVKECETFTDQVYPFIVGDGELLDVRDYDKINVDVKLMKYWGYGLEDKKVRHWNAMISHRMMIKRAKAAGWSRFLMLEDDAYITNRFKQVTESINGLDLNEIDLLYLGWWIGDENDKWNKDVEEKYNNGEACIQELRRAGGLHGVVINESMYDKILSLPLSNPIDSQLNQIHSSINSLVLLPKVIHIKSLYSECEGRLIERNEI